MRLPLVLFILTQLLYGELTLNRTYTYEHHNITSRTLFPYLEAEFLLLRIPDHKTRYRVSVETLTTPFAQRGISIQTGGHRYINFIKESPVNLQPLKHHITHFYEKHYPSIVIHTLNITPRTYTPSLPQGYSIHLGNNSYKYDSGTLFALTSHGKKFFFDYSLKADVPIFRTTARLSRDTILSPFNTKKSTLPFSQLKGAPLSQIPKGQYRLKRALKPNAILLTRHIEMTPLVTRGTKVAASLQDGAVLIQFQAEAIQDGGLHDMISVQKPDGQRIKARVVGKNKVEVE